jgi:ornithine decarboxylase
MQRRLKMFWREAMDVSESYPTPFFLFDLDVVRNNYRRLADAFFGASIHYAVKANNNPIILSTLSACGAKFEIASYHEADLLFGLPVPPRDLIFSAPIKLSSHIRDTFSRGVEFYAFDCRSELQKLAVLAPGCKALLRLTVGNEGSRFPLSTKFGANVNEAVSLMLEARRAGLDPRGIAFHVGSQCERVETWKEALLEAGEAWMILKNRGLDLSCLDIGGGFPIAYDCAVPGVEEIAAAFRPIFEEVFPGGTRIVAEPGRFMVGEAGIMVATVIGKATRNGENWLYVDASALHGLLEALQTNGTFPYPVRALREGDPEKKYVLSGPTCDPDDTILKEVWLPEMKVGDRLCILNAGAYSFVYSTNFHGYPVPDIHFIIDRDVRKARSPKETVSAA